MAWNPYTIGGQLAQAGGDILARRQAQAKQAAMAGQMELQQAQGAKALQDALWQKQQRESYTQLGDVFRGLMEPQSQAAPSQEFVGPMPAVPMADRVRSAAPQIAANMATAGGERFGELGKVMLALMAGDASPEGLSRAYAGAGHSAPVHGLLPQERTAYQSAQLGNELEKVRLQQSGENYRASVKPFTVSPGESVLMPNQLMRGGASVPATPGPAGAAPAANAGAATLANAIKPLFTAPGRATDNAPAGYQWNGAALQAIPGGPADPTVKGTKPLTFEEKRAAGFGLRMTEAEKILSELEDKGVSTAAYIPSVAGAVPLVGDALRNQVMSPEQQMYRQAAENWVRANLRLESGAVIAPEEMDREIANYFPKPGDRPEVLAQKRQNRIRLAQIVSGMGSHQEPQAPGIQPVAPGVAAGQRPRAVNPQTGAAVEWDGQSWVPAQ